MFDITFIVLARAIHVMAGVIWAGATFVLVAMIAPMAARFEADGAGRWFGLVMRRVGMSSGIAALATVLSGIYLFAAVHPHDDSLSGWVLKSGALAAILAMLVGALVGRPAGQRIGQLQAALREAPSEDSARELARLRRRATLGARLAAGLLAFAVLAMAGFRYASAFA